MQKSFNVEKPDGYGSLIYGLPTCIVGSSEPDVAVVVEPWSCDMLDTTVWYMDTGTGTVIIPETGKAEN